MYTNDTPGLNTSHLTDKTLGKDKEALKQCLYYLQQEAAMMGFPFTSFLISSAVEALKEETPVCVELCD